MWWLVVVMFVSEVLISRSLVYMVQFLNLLQTRGFIDGGRLARLVSVQQFSTLSQISDLTKFPVVCLGLNSAELRLPEITVSQSDLHHFSSPLLSSLLYLDLSPSSKWWPHPV